MISTDPAQPVRSYVICSLPRTGSNLLSFALEDTGLAGHPREYFCPRKESTYARDWLLPKNYSLQSFMKEMATHSSTTNGVWALKIHWHSFPQLMTRAKEEFGGSLGERELLQTCFPDARYIFVRRQDRVRQAISFLRAMDSAQWERRPGEPVSARMGRLAIDLDRIDPMVKLFAQQEDQWRDFFWRNGLDPYEVIYEDLTRDYRNVLLGALGHLGVRPAPGLPIGPPRLVRQSDHLTDLAVAMYHERAAGAEPGIAAGCA